MIYIVLVGHDPFGHRLNVIAEYEMPVNRAGTFVKHPEGYRAFTPSKLPPDPPIEFDPEMVTLLSQADQSLGRLDGISLTLPNPNLFVAMYVRREAVYSSQIEGTQSSLDDVLEYELGEKKGGLPDDVEEVVNYVRAMNHGLQRLNTLPLSARLIREIHAILMENVRGAEKQPGEFRRSPVWIGASNSTINDAAFVPPPHQELGDLIADLEIFMHQERMLPILVHCAVAHAQFETIHPFLDGNGRVGRLLITFLLCYREALVRPLLYLSYYLRRHRAEYYDRLTAIRESGDWEGWVRFFLRGVIDTADEATTVSAKILMLRDEHRRLVQGETSGQYGLPLLDLLYERPVISAGFVERELAVSSPTATKLVTEMEQLGILTEFTGGRRNRRYRYDPFLALFTEPDLTGSDSTEEPVDRTESV